LKILFSRPVTSYAKVQAAIGRALRNRRFQLRRPRVRALKYVDLGCGPQTHPGFINVDFRWHPGIDICWDISQRLPFASQSMKGVYTEHCLEHFSIGRAAAILGECRRILEPRGILRVVMPDAEAYLRTYCRQLDGDPHALFPYEEHERFEGIRSPILSVNRVFYQDRDSPSGHRFMADFHVLDQLLRKSGFRTVYKCEYRRGADPALLIDSAARASESLYVEATV
jgi:predicted SAM-dependent methyltransferase